MYVVITRMSVSEGILSHFDPSSSLAIWKFTLLTIFYFSKITSHMDLDCHGFILKDVLFTWNAFPGLPYIAVQGDPHTFTFSKLHHGIFGKFFRFFSSTCIVHTKSCLWCPSTLFWLMSVQNWKTQNIAFLKGNYNSSLVLSVNIKLSVKWISMYILMLRQACKNVALSTVYIFQVLTFVEKDCNNVDFIFAWWSRDKNCMHRNTIKASTVRPANLKSLENIKYFSLFFMKL